MTNNMTQNKFDLLLKFGRYLGMRIRLMLGMQERWRVNYWPKLMRRSWWRKLDKILLGREGVRRDLRKKRKKRFSWKINCKKRPECDISNQVVKLKSTMVGQFTLKSRWAGECTELRVF